MPRSKSPDGYIRILLLTLTDLEPSVQLKRGNRGDPRSSEWIHDEVSGLGGGTEASVNKGKRFLRRVFAENLLIFARWRDSPDTLHLLTAVLFPHIRVVERVLVGTSFGGLGSP